MSDAVKFVTQIKRVENQSLLRLGFLWLRSRPFKPFLWTSDCVRMQQLLATELASAMRERERERERFMQYREGDETERERSAEKVKRIPTGGNTHTSCTKTTTATICMGN
jgi:hypothetical protein